GGTQIEAYMLKSAAEIRALLDLPAGPLSPQDQARLEMYMASRQTDCHGYTFAQGKYWINNDQVGKILRGDGYVRTGSTFLNLLRGSNSKPIAVFSNRREGVIHSEFSTPPVPFVPTVVHGLAGHEPAPRTQLAVTRQLQASRNPRTGRLEYPFFGSTITFWEKAP